MRSLLILATALFVCAAPRAHAATLHQSTSQVCQNAPLVVIGTVSSVSSQWSNTGYGYIITSNVNFAVERVLHGSIGANVGVFVNGGRVGDVRLTVDATPDFATGERYLLLLHPRSGQPAMIFGQGAGAVRLDAEASLPSQAELVAEWEERCNG